MLSMQGDTIMTNEGNMCGENELQLMEHGIGIIEYPIADARYGGANNLITTNTTARRISRVNIIDSEYALTTVPEEEWEEVL